MIANKQLELMAKFELGLTPSSRTRLAVQIPTRPKPWEFGQRDEPDEFFDRQGAPCTASLAST